MRTSPLISPASLSTRIVGLLYDLDIFTAFTDEHADRFQDISARSPVIDAEVRPRQSLDARNARLPPALRRDSAMKFTPPATQPEDRFEDVGLDDAANKPRVKKGFFSRFGDSQGDASTTTAPADGTRPSGSHYTPSFFSRKRGQSGQGAELGSMPVKIASTPTNAVPEEVKVDG